MREYLDATSILLQIKQRPGRITVSGYYRYRPSDAVPPAVFDSDIYERLVDLLPNEGSALATLMARRYTDTSTPLKEDDKVEVVLLQEGTRNNSKTSDLDYTNYTKNNKG